MVVELDKLKTYTSAKMLSDMEILVFPELMYSLALANIISPIIWSWRNLDCFKKLDSKDAYWKVVCLKQFKINEFEFNLNSWGLTSKDREVERFLQFISPKQIAQSNALFGYNGDKYYFNFDI